MPFGPLLAWKRGDLLGAAQRLTAAGVAALIAIAVLWAWTRGGSAFAPLAIGLAVFVIAGALSDLAERTGLFRVPLGNRDPARARTAALDLGHGVRPCRRRRRPDRHRLRDHLEQRIYRIDEARRRREVAGYELKLDGVTQRQGPNFREMVAQFTVTLDGERARAS